MGASGDRARQEVLFPNRARTATDAEGAARVRAGTVSPASAQFDRYKVFTETKPIEAKPPPSLPQPTPEPRPKSPRHRVRCTVRPPNPDKGDPGQIIEASYTITGNLLRVYDEEGRELGVETRQAMTPRLPPAVSYARAREACPVLRSDQLSLKWEGARLGPPVPAPDRSVVRLLRRLARRHRSQWSLRLCELIIQFAVAHRSDQNVDD
jgi:hypothetical protein